MTRTVWWLSGGGGFKLLAATGDKAIARFRTRASPIWGKDEVRDCLLGGSGNHGLRNQLCSTGKSQQGISECDLDHNRSWLAYALVTDVSGGPSGPSATESVRLAWPSEARGIADVQRRAWAAQTVDVADALLGSIDADTMAGSWQAAIERPPQARCRVLVAIEQGRVVGFATTVPGSDPDLDPSADGQIDELEVDPSAQHRGHGSRLLNASVDTLRADGFRRAVCWISATDDVRRGFLIGAGWAADGSWREIGSDEASVRLKQVRLHTDLG